MLKYFKKIETHHDPKANPEAHGFAGPITTTAGARRYPLGDTVFTALVKSGNAWNPDANGGNPLGLGAFTENWKDLQRQPAGKAYDLSKANVFTESPVAQVIIDPESKTATGAKLVDERIFKATKEVIVSCGALRTPQVLILSGIGPAAELRSFGIPVLADLPVGQGLHDHLSGTLFWKLRNPELGLAVGSPLFNKPEYGHGNPTQWIITSTMPKEELAKVIEVDKMDPNDRFISEPRCHVEFIVPYAPVVGGGSDFQLPFDGTHISTPVILLLPTSRGNVTIMNTDPLSNPIINPHYLETEADRASLRTGLRKAMCTMETFEGQSIVIGETPPPGDSPLKSDCTDAELDKRMRLVGCSFFQNGGTAAMGEVVDTECRVKGIKGLRVCDASVLPLPISGHYQGPMYAFGESMADLILGRE
jgi:choline dehydrogenase-like flavoprotein